MQSSDLGDVEAEGMMKLNLGCGRDIREGWVNIDREHGPGVDLVLDLDEGSLPFADGTVDEIRAWAVFEHLWNWEDLLLECHRVLRNGGRIEILVPYRDRICSAYHKRLFDLSTMDVFLEGYSGNTLEARPMFRKVSGHRHHLLPFTWHVEKRLGIDLRHIPIGWTEEVHWILEKVGGD